MKSRSNGEPLPHDFPLPQNECRRRGWKSDRAHPVVPELPERSLGESISPKKKTDASARGPQPSISPKKKGRKKGSRNKQPASGSLSPTVQVKKGKTYPIVQGERVAKELAYDYPHQFIWIYNWSVRAGDGWKNRSKRVPMGKVHRVKSAIAASQPVDEILKLIDL